MPIDDSLNRLLRNPSRSISDNVQWYNNIFQNNRDLQVASYNSNYYLRPGKAYSFFYNPLNKNRMSYYDKNPTVISLGKKIIGKVTFDLCINFNFLPLIHRVELMRNFYNLYENTILDKINRNPFNANSQEYINVDYEELKKYLNWLNITFAVRLYYKTRRYDTGIISYENFYRVPFIAKYNFVGSDKIKINSKYYGGRYR